MRQIPPHRPGDDSRRFYRVPGEASKAVWTRSAGATPGRTLAGEDRPRRRPAGSELVNQSTLTPQPPLPRRERGSQNMRWGNVFRLVSFSPSPSLGEGAGG
jgi:hypothetical protein